MGAGVHFLPFEINLGKSEIILALNSSIKICGKDLYILVTLINIRRFFVTFMQV